ncbi:MAG: ribosomal RNA small subunit methyltransferase A [Candidatus Delongbacteria bacterium]|nr:ribosomal RNA small subunit methyltransferase A [Candidatus Delongbacteria bacterium]MBN2835327.1 ribosomal RNA small subunit methyltransferase A [Candidatus Delongbacteria bacterium]
MIEAKKSLGQNFLKNKHYKEKIVDGAEVREGDTVVEIGPGMGALTEIMLSRGAKVTAIEIDRRLQEYLEENINSEDFSLIKNDFLKTDPKEYLNSDFTTKIIGNLPYHVTSEIIFKVMDIIKDDIETSQRIESFTIMIQKEVAHRLCSIHGNKVYGVITVLTDLFCTKKLLFDVPPDAFVPKPKVTSTVMRFDTIKNNENFKRLKSYKLFRTLVKTVFLNRRKMLRNTLKPFIDPEIITTIDITRRPESLDLNEFINLTNEVFELRGNE